MLMERKDHEPHQRWTHLLMEAKDHGPHQRWTQVLVGSKDHGPHQRWTQVLMEAKDHGSHQRWTQVLMEAKDHGPHQRWTQVLMEGKDHRPHQKWTQVLMEGKQWPVFTLSVRRNWRCNQEWTIQRNRQLLVHKMNTNKHKHPTFKIILVSFNSNKTVPQVQQELLTAPEHHNIKLEI
jgi:hypothetical protein